MLCQHSASLNYITFMPRKLPVVSVSPSCIGNLRMNKLFITAFKSRNNSLQNHLGDKMCNKMPGFIDIPSSGICHIRNRPHTIHQPVLLWIY